MAEPIVNPELPFVGDVPAGLQPGKMLRFQGVTHPNSDRFNINLATGPNAKPRDDTALHISVRLNQGYIARNTYKDGTWGDEQGSGRLPIGQAQSFEIIILVDPNNYKVAVNGQHFCEFPHRIPYQQVTNLLIDGDVSLTLISFEGIPISGNETAALASQVNAEGPQGGPQYGPPPGAYGVPPPNYGGYAPPPPPGAQPQSELGGFFEQAQDILAGAIKSGAAEKLLGGILHSSGQPQQQPQGYAPQNARYGIYPDLPTQDTTQIPTQNVGNANAQDSALSDLIAGSGGTVTTGPQPIPQSGGNAPPSGGQNLTAGQQNPGPVENLLMGFFSGNGGQGNGSQPNAGAGQPQSAQSGSSDILSGLLSGLLNTNSQNQQPGIQNPTQPGVSQHQPVQGGGPDVLSGILQSLLSGNKEGNAGAQNPTTGGQAPQNSQGSQGQGSDVLSGILSSLLSSNQGPQGPNQSPFNPQNTPQPTNQGSGQGQGSDVLSGILSSLLSPSQSQQGPQNPNPPPQNTSQPQGQAGGEALGNILQGLISGNSQQQNSGPGPTQNVPPHSYNQPPYPQNPGQAGTNNAEMLTNLLQGLLSKAREQHDSTRPIQETHPAGGTQGPTSNENPQQQYGQYPHPPQQEQKGPMESLLSGLLSGGGQQQQQQQPHVPQVGGEGSIGGLGSMGGILGSLAGSLLHRPDQNQGH